MPSPEAFFDNISEILLEEITSAKNSIYVAVAWFTNLEIFSALVEKAKSGCKVSVILVDDEINRGSYINHDNLNLFSSKVYWIDTTTQGLMHNKFCILDNHVIITGSYNWSYRAERNFENIVIIRDYYLASRYIVEFNNIILILYPNSPCLDESLNTLEQSNLELAVWVDPKLATLRFHIELLEFRLVAMVNEKNEAENLIDRFQNRYFFELNDLILEVLHLRKIRFNSDTVEYQEAAHEEAHFKQEFSSIRSENFFELTDEELELLKANFRKASLLCHPDMVPEEDKIVANEIFLNLQKAYKLNDLKHVQEICEMLDLGYFDKDINRIHEIELLENKISRLKLQIGTIENELSTVRDSKIFLTISKIISWDDYFKETKKKLELEKERLIQNLPN